MKKLFKKLFAKNACDAQRDYFRRSARGEGNDPHGFRGHDVGLRRE